MKCKVLAILTSIVAASSTLHAAAVTYSTAAGFLAALSALGVSPSTESFEAPFGASASQVFANFTVTEGGPAANLFRTTTFATDGVASLAVNLDSGVPLTFQFPSPIHAFAVDVRNSVSRSVTIETNLGAVGSTPATTDAFFGFIDSTQSFTSVTIRQSGSGGAPFFAFDQVRSAVVPEPSTAALGGLGMLILMRRRRSASGRNFTLPAGALMPM